MSVKMEYFILTQDKRVMSAIRPLNIAKLVTGCGLASESWDNLDKLPAQYFFEETSDPEYVDLIANPVPLVSKRLKQLFQKFDSKIFFKPVVLADLKEMRKELYWLMNPPGCACVATQSEFNKDRSVKRLVIDSRKAEGNWIFRVDGILERLLVVNLGVAEAMLRRDFSGVKLIRVDSVAT